MHAISEELKKKHPLGPASMGLDPGGFSELPLWRLWIWFHDRSFFEIRDIPTREEGVKIMEELWGKPLFPPFQTQETIKTYPFMS